MPECTGRVADGVLLRRRARFAAAATSRVDGKASTPSVCYYGSAINGMLAMVDGIDCPVMYHYGDADDFIPAETSTRWNALVSGVQTSVPPLPTPAGHAFSNWDAPSMYHEPAAD